MKYALAVAAALLVVSTPALASGGFDCRASDRSGLRLSGVTGRGIITPLVSARLVQGRRISTTSGDRPTVSIGQSCIDDRGIRVDLVDPQALRFEARLRAKPTRRNQAVGTLVRNGKTHAVRCVIE